MKHTVPFFSLKRQWNNVKDAIMPKLNELLESNQFVGGKYVAEFEKQFAQYINAQPTDGISPHAISCNSGTDALWLALKALEVTSQSIVLTTPFSFIASSSEIVAHNAYPVFIDIDASYNICPKKIETWLKLHATMCKNKAVHKKTGLPISGIITVDLFGQCAQYDAIKAIADEWNLWIIEDACQAVGAHINKKKAGTLGDISCFSLYPTKNLGACGDGGVLTTSNAALAEKLLKLRNHGRKSHYNYECYGINSRLDAIQAAVATEKLKLIDSLNKRRREIAHTYTKRLSKLSFIKTPQEITGYHVYHQYAIQTDRSIRDFLREYLQEKNVGTNIVYPKTLDQISYLQPPEELKTDCPVAHAATETIFSLPIWPELTNEEVEYVCKCLEEVTFKNPSIQFPTEITRGERP